MNTGIVRKIDELGRIVIPKEIRKNLNIRNGEDVQIFIQDNSIVLKKYEKLLSMKENADIYINNFKKLTSSDIIITDKEKVISSCVSAYVGNKIDSKIISLVDERKQEEGYFLKFDTLSIEKKYLVCPIIVDADSIGSIILLSDSAITDQDKLLAHILNILLTMNLC